LFGWCVIVVGGGGGVVGACWCVIGGRAAGVLSGSVVCRV